MAIRVVIVDDHAGFRRSARSILEAAGFDVVGEASDGASALRLAGAMRPDMVLLDVMLPDVSGFDLAKDLDATVDPPVVVLTSSREAADYGRRIERSSAAGFISKADLTGAAVRELVATLR